MVMNDGLCGANKKDGTTCKLVKGFGTDHKHSGRCKYHSGASPGGKRAAAREVIQNMVLDSPNVDPYSVLDGAIRRSWAEVLWLQEKMAQADEDDPSGVSSAALWHKLYGEWLDRAGKLSKTAMDAGVAERQVRVIEAQGQMLAIAIRTILDGLGLTKDQQAKAPQLVRATLLQLEAG
jgi:hypothetical protein